MAASAFVLLFAACQKEDPSATLSEGSATVADVETTYSVAVKSNVEISVVSDADWAIAEFTEGTLNIKVEENYGAERTANITLNYKDSPLSNFTLVQKAGATDDIKEVEAFYYGKIESYAAGTENWTISCYTASYLDDDKNEGYTYNFDIMAPSEFTFVSGKFPTGTYELNTEPVVGAVYSVDSYIRNKATWDSTPFTSASITIEATDVEDEYVLYVKANDRGKPIKFSFKAVCGGGNGFDLRKYDTRVNSTITKDYDINFSSYEAYVYANDDESYDLELTLSNGTPAMGEDKNGNGFTDTMLTLYVPASDDFSGEYTLDFDFTCAPYTIFYFSRYWWFSGVYPDPTDETWLRPLDHGNLCPSSGSATLTKQEDGWYKIEGSFVDDYTDDYPTKHTVTFHGKFKPEMCLD